MDLEHRFRICNIDFGFGTLVPDLEHQTWIPNFALNLEHDPDPECRTRARNGDTGANIGTLKPNQKHRTCTQSAETISNIGEEPDPGSSWFVCIRP